MEQMYVIPNFSLFFYLTILFRELGKDFTTKYEMLRTGGGTPLADIDDTLDERVRSMVPTIDLEIKNC